MGLSRWTGQRYQNRYLGTGIGRILYRLRSYYRHLLVLSVSIGVWCGSATITLFVALPTSAASSSSINGITYMDAIMRTITCTEINYGGICHDWSGTRFLIGILSCGFQQYFSATLSIFGPFGLEQVILYGRIGDINMSASMRTKDWYYYSVTEACGGYRLKSRSASW